MSMQSFLAKAGLRLSILGSAASLAIAAPIADGNPNPAAHTYANRTGVYFPTATSIGVVTNGAENLRIWDDGGVQVGGPYISSPGAGNISCTALNTAAATTSLASLNIPHGVAPTVPVNGDMWTTTAGLFVQINGSTVALGAGGGIGGSIAANQVAVGSGVNTVAGSANLTWSGTALAVTGTAAFTGNMAVGTTVATDTNIKSRTDTTADVHCYGVDVFNRIGGSAATQREITALTVSAYNIKTAGTGDWVTGAVINVTCTGVGGKSESAEGIRAYVTTSHAAVTAYGLNVRMTHNSTVTTSYGLYLNNTGAGVVTNKWGVYQVDANTKNYFAGFTGIGITTSTTSLLTLGASTTAVSSLRITHGAAPTSPVNGDMWTTTAGLYIRINGATVGPLS